MRKIPFFRQKNEHYCAPAVAQMVFAAYGIRYSQDALAREMKTPKTLHEGTKPAQIVKILRAHGLTVKAGERQSLRYIRAALKRDEIVIVCFTEPVEEWGHYAIVNNFKDETIELIDSDSRTGLTSLLTTEFSRRWKDPLFTKTTRWAAIVSSTGTAPKQRSSR